MMKKNDESCVWQDFVEKMSAIYKVDGLSYTNILEIVIHEVEPVFYRAVNFLQTYKKEEKNEKV